jgi:hypothetical protein
MTPPDATNERVALAEQRNALALKRDRLLQDLLITHEYADEGRRSDADIATATAEAKAACEAVAAFDARQPGVRTTANAEDDTEAPRFLELLTNH